MKKISGRQGAVQFSCVTRSGSVGESTAGYSHARMVVKKPNPQSHGGCLLLISTHPSLGDTGGILAFRVAYQIGIQGPCDAPR